MIQEHIKKPLAEEVLFGRLKSGGHVRVIVVTDEAGQQARLRLSRRTGDAAGGQAARTAPRQEAPVHITPQAVRAARRRHAAAPRDGPKRTARQGVTVI